MAFSIIKKAFSPDYELANGIIKTRHLDGNDPDITKKVNQLKIDNNIKKGIYKILELHS